MIQSNFFEGSIVYKSPYLASTNPMLEKYIVGEVKDTMEISV